MLAVSTSCLLISLITVILYYIIDDEIFRLMAALTAIGCLFLCFVIAPLSVKLLIFIAALSLNYRFLSRHQTSWQQGSKVSPFHRPLS